MDCVINVIHPITVVALIFAAFVFGFFRGYKRKLTSEMLKIMKEVVDTMAVRREAQIRKNARRRANGIINDARRENGKDN